MWPWQHVVVGYVAYSVLCHLWRREAPRGPETLVVAFASLLPDLVDKPLAWSFGVVQTGYGPAHSVFFALPFVVAVGSLGLAGERPWTGTAFGVGYLLHLPSDVLHNAIGPASISPEILLWPVATYHAGDVRFGFVRESIVRIDGFQAAVTSGGLSAYTQAQFALMAAAVVLWLYDGAPLLRESVSGTRTLLADRF